LFWPKPAFVEAVESIDGLFPPKLTIGSSKVTGTVDGNQEIPQSPEIEQLDSRLALRRLGKRR
jgi:hypothetical protein